MRDLVLSFTVAIIIVAVAFLLFTAIGIEDSIAFSISSSVLGAVPYMHQNMKRRRARKAVGANLPPPSLEGYGIRPGLMFVYATILFMATLQFTGAVGGIIWKGLETDLSAATGLASLLVAMPLCVLVGRFVARRIQARGIVVIVTSAFLARSAATYLDSQLSIDDPEIEQFMQTNMIFGFNFLGMTVHALFATAILSLFALLGYWRVRRNRLMHYLGYLMKNVSPDIRNTIVELAYEESLKSVQPAKRRSWWPFRRHVPIEEQQPSQNVTPLT